MRVLYLLNFAGKAGTERYVQSLVESLNHKEIEAFFVYNVSGLLVERMKEMGVPCFHLEMRSRLDRKAAKTLSDLCKRWKIDVIHAHYLRENYIAMLSKRWNPGVKVVYTSHFIMDNNWYTRVSNRILSSRQDRVISVCTVGKESLIRNGLDGAKIQVIFNAVDPGYWKKPEPSTLRQELGISEEIFVMLCASRFADDKGHQYLIDSIALLKQQTQRPFLLVLAGDGELLGSSKEQVSALGLDHEVRFIGFRKDMKNLYQGSSLYVNSSRHEALSFLIIEAMAAGLPVIATDMGGNRDIVNEANGCGILVEYPHPASMAAAMKTLLEDPDLLARYREGALRTVEEKFNLSKMAKATYQVYQDACGNVGYPENDH
ncbi:MAG: glycosyltransferase family 4 protein [Oscillospiraceae bacterium]|nr:glycosyltransferase family 4 protein [Oscillospiraceae bacterium]